MITRVLLKITDLFNFESQVPPPPQFFFFKCPLPPSLRVLKSRFLQNESGKIQEWVVSVGIWWSKCTNDRSALIMVHFYHCMVCWACEWHLGLLIKNVYRCYRQPKLCMKHDTFFTIKQGIIIRIVHELGFVSTLSFAHFWILCEIRFRT